MSDQKQRCFAIVAPGLEAIAGAELAGLGVRVGETVVGGVSFDANDRQLCGANLHLRTVSRVVVRVARFRAAAFWELEKQARKIRWENWVTSGRTVSFSVSSHKSKLYHQRGIADRLFEAVVQRVGGAVRTDGDDSQLFLARVERDEVVISVDSSGPLLHQRGYRQASAKAPLRETLAAAMLLGVGWDGSRPLIDPFCGSGTIPIEAALLARRIPPGLRRSFAFEAWPGIDRALWEQVKAEAFDRMLSEAPVPIAGSDRDAGAIAAAMANADRAGVADSIRFERQALSRVSAPESPGWLISNPPFGHRVGEAARLRDLYARLGQVIRRLEGWSAGLLVADARLAGHTGLALRTAWRSRTGGIPVRFLVTDPGVSG